MIELTFYYGTEMEKVVVTGHNLQFSVPGFNQYSTTIEGLRLNKTGVIKEHPDLSNNPDWREEAIKRFKKHVKELNQEQAIAEYVIMELKKFGHIPKFKKINGFRTEVIT